MSDVLEKSVRAYYEAVDARDVDALLALFADDAVYRRPGYPPLEGKAALAGFYRGERIIASGAHTLETVIAADNEVAVRGRFAGQAKDGRELAVRFADFFRFAGGEIVERNTYFDAAAV